jgi:hypothetical protein
MPAWVSDKGSDFKLVPPGTYVAVCDCVVMLGKQSTPFGVKEQVYIRWEIPSERLKWKDANGAEHEGPMVIGAVVTASIYEKSNLGQWLASWRGRSFTDEERKRFDLFSILGKPCMLNVVHNESKGKTYANVQGVSRLMKGMEAPNAEQLIKYSADETGEFDKLPEWLQKKIEAQITEEAEAQEEQSRPKNFTDDDIPF